VDENLIYEEYEVITNKYGQNQHEASNLENLMEGE